MADDGSKQSTTVWPLPKFYFQVKWDSAVLSFEEVSGLDVEAQPIGRLSHQVMHRGTGWRRVRGGSRFVPRDAPDDSPLFVEWRREGGTWVVSAVGDESFHDVPLPAWCC